MTSVQICEICEGSGKTFKDKYRCRKCNGAKVVETRKPIELHIPPGSLDGDKVILQGEADQIPGQEPGDIIFKLVEIKHRTFRRVGSDLCADLEVSLREALTGLERVVLIHLDGRGIKTSYPRKSGQILKPGQVLKVTGEGMPKKGNNGKGDLYLAVKITFPDASWLRNPEIRRQLQELLPDVKPAFQANTIREVYCDDRVDIENLDVNFSADGGDEASEETRRTRTSSSCTPQ